MKDKGYYLGIYDKKWISCLADAELDINKNGGDNVEITEVATEIFEETANAEEIVGYYIMYHREFALKDWNDNTKGINFTEQDKEIDTILKELYK